LAQIEVEVHTARWDSGPNFAPNWILVTSLQGWYGLTWADTLDGLGECQVTVSRATETTAFADWVRNDNELLAEIRVIVDGFLRWAGPITGVNAQQQAGGGYVFSFRAAGLFAYLHGLVFDPTVPIAFNNVDQHVIVRQIIDAAQAIGYGNFGLDTSAITASGKLRKVNYERWDVVGERLRQLSQIDQGFDLWIDADRVVHCDYPQAGSDQRQIIYDNRNLWGAPFVVSTGFTDYLSSVVTLGDVPEDSPKNTPQPAAVVTNTGAVTRIGYRAMVQNAADKTSDPATLAAVGQRALNNRIHPAMLATPNFMFGEIEPFQLSLGDRFTLELDVGFGAPYHFEPRVVGRRFSADARGAFSMQVDLE
jgi:hypothetical protein